MSEKKDALRARFEEIDSDGTGFISFEELSKACEEANLQLNETELEIMFEAADMNEDGKISYEEFIENLDI